MGKFNSIEGKWAGTVGTLILFDIATAGIFMYLLVNRIKGYPGFPSCEEILLVLLIFLVGNVALYYFMRAMKDTVKHFVRDD